MVLSIARFVNLKWKGAVLRPAPRRHHSWQVLTRAGFRHGLRPPGCWGPETRSFSL